MVHEIIDPKQQCIGRNADPKRRRGLPHMTNTGKNTLLTLPSIKYERSAATRAEAINIVLVLSKVLMYILRSTRAVKSLW